MKTLTPETVTLMLIGVVTIIFILIWILASLCTKKRKNTWNILDDAPCGMPDSTIDTPDTTIDMP